MKSLNSNRGFVLMFGLLFLPFLAALGVGALQVLRTHQIQLGAEQICRVELLETQKKVGLGLQTLLSLNPLASFLEADKLVTQAGIAAAVSSFNFPLAAKLTKKLNIILNRQRILEKKQKMLIQAVNQVLRVGVYQAQWRLQLYLNKNIEGQGAGVLQRTTKLQVRALRPGIAPEYDVRPNFESEQRIMLRWSYSQLLQGSRDSCAATLVKKEGSWVANLYRTSESEKGRFLSSF